MRRAAAAALCCLALAAPAVAAPIMLPAGRLGEAVIALGRQGGASIRVDDPVLWAKPVPALSGSLSVRAALGRLAEAAGAKVLRAGDGWRLVAATRPTRNAPAPARAAASPAPADEEIIVTASKRDVRLTDYSGQASLLNGADLSFGGPGGTDAILARVAGVSSTHLGAGRNKLFIRGIADSSFTGPTQSTVGQYLGDLRLTYNAPDPDLRLYDMAAVEVLEGPQGTLYGAGSLGGIIRIDPAPPDPRGIAGALAGGVSATQHGDPGADLAGMLNLPLGPEGSAFRAVGYGVSEGGYIDDAQGGGKDVNRTRIWGGRAAVRGEFGGGWSAELGGVFQRIRGEDSQYADRGGKRLTRSSAVDEGFGARYALGQLVVSGDWDGLRFRSSTGYARQRLAERFDASVPAAGGLNVGGPIAVPVTAFFDRVVPIGPVAVGEALVPRLLAQRNDTRLIASENRLWRPMADGVGWVVGASYTDNRTRLGRAFGPPGRLLPVTGVVNRIREGTLYGEASVAVLPGLTLTAGGRVVRARLSGEARDVAPTIAATRAAIAAGRTETTALPSAALTAALLPRLTLFARFQEGFRPGGLALEGDFVRRFRNDRVRTLESGVRLGQPSDRIDLAASVSYTRWRDIQADFIDGTGLPSTANIGDGTIWTLSASGGWRPLPGLRLDAALTYNDSDVTDPAPLLVFALARMSQVPNVASFAGRIGFDYRRPLGEDWQLHVAGWARYTGRSRLGIGPVLGEAQGDYLDTALIARIGRESGLGLSIGVTNLTDSVGNRFALGTPFFTGRGQITPLRPRTLRIGLDTAF